MVFPVAVAGEPGKCNLERRIFPAPGEPRGVVHDTQTAQGLDKVQLARIEISEQLVAVE